ncbi:hypothetical protein QCM77_07590, partial [Bradyrhizobium sp. SSUT18]|nr:hypothetical protein [Bradyrhizobium sp. SSUT18]
RRYCRPAALQLPQSRHCLNGPVSPDTSAIHQNRRRAEKIALTNRPGLESIEAALATLGFGLVPVAALEALDHPELAGELTALALKMRMNIPQTWAALIDIGIEQKLLRMRADERAAILAEHESRLAGIAANDNQKRRRKAA